MVIKIRLLSALLFLAITIPGLAQQQTTRFDGWDQDKDGKLTRDELPEQLRKNFDRVDKDQDGFISREEDAAVKNRNRSAPRSGKPPAAPANLDILADLPYANNENPRQTLDLFLPKDRGDQPLPLLVFIHGGGWRNGSKDGAARRLAPFLESGDYAGASLNYRLTDEAPWPAQIHDCKAALRWLRGNAEKYGIDPEKIAVWGTSAGGHLVAMLGVSHGVEGLEGELGEHSGESSAVQAVINYFGPSELLTMDDHPGTMTHNGPESPEALLVGGPIQEHQDKARNASPVTHAGKNDAPMLLVHGTDDPLVPFPQSEKLDQLLDQAKVESILITVDGGGHGKGFPEDLTAIVRQFLDRQLRDQEATIEEVTLPATP
jgi:acetyl esterase/lipase